MRACLRPALGLGLALLAGAHAASADGPRAADRAFVEVVARRSTPFVGEPFELVLRIGYDAAYFETHAVPLFRQEVDLPVEVTAPWAIEWPDATGLPERPRDEPAAARRLTFSLNGRAAAGEPVAPLTRDGVTFAVVEVVRRFRLDVPAARTLTGPTLRYVHATKFEDDFLRGRVATDPSDVLVRGAALELHVASLPAQGRPPEFAGAVGRFTLEAAVAPTTVAAGGTVRLTLRLRGQGDLPSVEPPRLDLPPSFHVYGALDDHGAVVRTLVFEISPLSADATEIPPVRFAYLDPGPPAAYRVVRTETIPLTVTPTTDGAQGARGGSAPDRPASRGLPPPWLLAAGLVAAVGAIAWTIRRRRVARAAAAAADPGRTRATGAAAAFRATLARRDVDPADAFAEYLSAHLRCSPAAVIAPELARRLETAGVPPALAARAAAALEALVFARYGAGGAVRRSEDLLSLVDELEAVLGSGFEARRSASR